jgi:dephospho-CoA kinase
MVAQPLRIGLTGGIGSGKSTAAAVLATLGAKVIDTDAISRMITAAGGCAIDPISRQFGPEFIDATGALDRARMRALAFSDAQARSRLEAILHPLIGAEATRLAADPPLDQTLLFDVPLLVESGRWRALVDRVLVIDCSEATQVARVQARPGWTPGSVRAVISQQASRSQRRACADAVVFNDGVSRDSLAEQLALLWRHWIG